MQVHVKTTTKKLLTNSVYNTVSWFLIVAIGILFTPFIVKKLTIEGYGIYTLLTSLIGYYGLLDLGLGDGVTKFVAEYKARNDWDGVNRSVNAALLIQIILGAIGSGCLVFFADGILHLLKVPEQFFIAGQQGVRFVSIGFFFTMLSGTFSAALKGLQSYKQVSQVNVFMNFAMNIAMILVLFLGGGLIGVVILPMLYSMVSFVIYWVIFSKQVPGYRFVWSFDKQSTVSVFNYSGFLFLSRLSNTFNNYVVRFVIGFFLGPAFVAFYFIPSRVVQTFGGLLGSLFGVIFPYTSELSAGQDLEKIQRVFLKTTKLFVSLSMPVFLALAVFAGPILNLWMGPEFAQKGWRVLMVLSLGSILGSITTVPNLIAMGLGQSKIISLFSVFTVLAYAVFMPFFTKWWGIEGAAWAILFAQIPGIFLVFYEIKNIFKLPLMSSLWEILAYHCLPIVITCFLLMTFQGMLGFNRTCVFLGLGLYFALYFGGMLLTNWLPAKEVFSHFLKKGSNAST
ncbi:MAG: oligosaccharide flippase family protein [Candidatus Omnitrophota bacterium]